MQHPSDIQKRVLARQRELLALVEEAESETVSAERLVEIVEVEFPLKAWNYPAFTATHPVHAGMDIYGSFYCDLLNNTYYEYKPFAERLISSFLKNPLLPEEKIFQKTSLIAHFWQDLAQNPMLPLWFESDNEHVLSGIMYYYMNVEHRSTISSYKISFLLLLLKGEDKYDEKILSLLEEGINEVGRFAGHGKRVVLPRIKPTIKSETSKLKIWYKANELSTPEVARLFQIVTGRKNNQGKILRDPAIPCDDFCRTILTSHREQNEFKPRLIVYLRWLHKVAKTVGKPMPKHLLSAVFPEEAFDVG